MFDIQAVPHQKDVYGERKSRIVLKGLFIESDRAELYSKGSHKNNLRAASTTITFSIKGRVHHAYFDLIQVYKIGVKANVTQDITFPSVGS